MPTDNVPPDSIVPASPGKICPVCGAAYPFEILVCPGDGARLRTNSMADDLAGHVIADRYRIIRKLGEGGMGRVYLAEQISMSRMCALKIMPSALRDDPEVVARFRRAASEAGRISHPNVAALYDSGESADQLYLAMEYVPGESLRRLARREGPLSPPRAIGIAMRVASALEAAHRLGILHRDLKPDNIVLSRSDEGDDLVKVVDFGIVMAAWETASPEMIARAGIGVGTLLYMSPEQLIGSGTDARGDLYSLGAILYELLTGKRVYEDDTGDIAVSSRLDQLPRRPRELNPGISSELDELVMRLLAIQPAERFQSARELRVALAAISIDSAAESPRSATPPRQRAAAPDVSVADGTPGEIPIDATSTGATSGDPPWLEATPGVPAPDVPTAAVPASGALASEVPVSDAPVSDISVSDISASGFPISEVPVSEVPAADIPASGFPISDVPGSNAPISDVPGSNVPASDAPASDAPAPDAPASVLGGPPDTGDLPASEAAAFVESAVGQVDPPSVLTEGLPADPAPTMTGGKGIAPRLRPPPAGSTRRRLAVIAPVLLGLVALGTVAVSVWPEGDPDLVPADLPKVYMLGPAEPIDGADGDLEVMVYGSEFIPESAVLWNGMRLSTTFIDANTLRAVVPSAELASTVEARVTVQNAGASISLPLEYRVGFTDAGAESEAIGNSADGVGNDGRLAASAGAGVAPAPPPAQQASSASADPSPAGPGFRAPPSDSEIPDFSIPDVPILEIDPQPIPSLTGSGYDTPVAPGAPRLSIQASSSPTLLNASRIGREVTLNYPPDLRAAGIGGTAILRISLDATGAISEVQVATSSGQPALDGVAVRIIRRTAQFAPATLDGRPVPIEVEIPVSFVPGD